MGVYSKDRRIQATQITKRPLEKLQTMFGGTIKEERRRTSLGKRPAWRWEIYNGKAQAAATLLLPYAQVKHEQLKVLIECKPEPQDRAAYAAARERTKELNSGI